jgi:hypothetical protein
MKHIYTVLLVFAFSITQIKTLFAQTPEYGITVIVHGFAGFGDLDPSWRDLAQSIAKRAGNAVIYKNNPTNGRLIQLTTAGAGNGEIILLYDWADLSDNGILNLPNNPSGVEYNDKGYLEAGADNLFATLLTPSINLINSNRPIHVIGHSRGCVLSLQVFHRLLYYFPNRQIEHFSLLDPHPTRNLDATLPCIYPNPSGSEHEFFIQLPNNIVKADNHFRADGQYERLLEISNGSWDWRVFLGSFDGINVKGIGNFNRRLNEPIIASGSSSQAGGSHSGVHEWFRGTIDQDIQRPNWYGQGVFDTLSHIFETSPTNNYRSLVGYNYSRLSGNYNNSNFLPAQHKLSINALNLRLGQHKGVPIPITPDWVFNGDFIRAGAGWILNGGSSNVDDESMFRPILFDPVFGRYASLNGHGSKITHSYCFFGHYESNINDKFKYLQFSIRVPSATATTNPKLNIIFYNDDGIEISRRIIVLVENNRWQTTHQAIPEILRGKVGKFRFEVENTADVDLDNITFSVCRPDCDCNDIPLPPTNLSANSISLNNSVTLNWSDNETTETGYIIQQSVGTATNWVTIASLPPNTTTHSLSGLQNNTTYWYRIRATENCLSSEYNVFNSVRFETYTLNKIINTLEYFIDLDPGFGNGTPVIITASGSIEHDFTVPLTGISEGIHTLYVRAKDNNNRWSNIHSQVFLKTAGVGGILRIEKLEYFIDEDPGFGIGTDVPLSNIANLKQPEVNFVVNLDNTRDGVHILYIRAKDSGGKWSMLFSRPFVRLQGIGGNTEVAKLEYFIDTDPGFGLGTDMPITAATSLDKQFSVDLSAVTNGVHTLYVRTKDNKGKWSSLFIRPFMKIMGQGGQPIITQLEYYFDTDPGLGNGTSIAVTPSASVNISRNVSLAALSTGKHRLYIRAKDGNELWSHIFYDTVHINPTWVVPVELSQFTVQLVKNNGLLKWVTQSEKNTNVFEIERSIDATKFNKIGEVKGFGNSNAVKNYTFTDKFLEGNQVYYYRLKIVDLDGSSTYSEIKSLYLTNEKKFSATIFPNPNDGVFSVILKGSIDTKLPINVSIIDLQGKSILSLNNVPILSDNMFNIDLKDVVSGAYYLVIRNGAQLISQQVVKY